MSPFGRDELAAVAGLMRQASLAEILPRFHAGDRGDVRQKTSLLDLVTDTDLAAERMLTEGLQRLFPGVPVIGEEACSADPSLLEGLDRMPSYFLVDPIDGTKNFASGLPLFGTMIAFVEDDAVMAGIILDPIGDDFVMALRGKGAWFQARDASETRLTVAEARPVAEMVGLVSWMFLAEPLRSRVSAGMTATLGAAEYRAAAHHYRLLARKAYDFALWGKLMPWDHAAGSLIHAEAGGYNARFDGSAYRPSLTAGGLLAAPDEASWRALHATLLA
ncbi:inositol monophosphatase family protein [Aquibium sp. LZ166]|uniref:Inositol monophosphatase family protein n=1 Tax=Aquibium pacificus TaxID=3153579 RepID=A0ABV3SGL3_9HYPH